MEFNQYIWHVSCANHVVASCSLKQSKSKPLVLHLPSYCPLHSFSTSFLNMIYTLLCIFPPLVCSNPLSAFCSHFSMENVLTSSPLSSMWATQDIFTLSSPGISAQFTCFRKPSLEWWSSCCWDSVPSFSSSSSSPSSECLRSSGLGTGKHLSCVKPSS